MLADEIHPADEQLENDTNNNIPRGVIDPQILSFYDLTQVLFDNFDDLRNRHNENVLLFIVTKFKCLVKIWFNFLALIAFGLSFVLARFCR